MSPSGLAARSWQVLRELRTASFQAAPRVGPSSADRLKRPSSDGSSPPGPQLAPRLSKSSCGPNLQPLPALRVVISDAVAPGPARQPSLGSPPRRPRRKLAVASADTPPVRPTRSVDLWPPPWGLPQPTTAPGAIQPSSRRQTEAMVVRSSWTTFGLSVDLGVSARATARCSNPIASQIR